MWLTLVVMAAAVSLEPFRVGMAVALLNRPLPPLQLTAFLCGGFLMGMSVGAAVLFALEPRLPRSTHFTLPAVQIAIGALALAAAVVVALTPGRAPSPPAWLARLWGGPSLWPAGIAGLGIALPSVDYLAALAVIAAAGVSPATQLSALVLFNTVAFAVVEIPLLAYLAAPARTLAAMTALHHWLRSRSRRQVAAALAVLGLALIIAGLLGR